MSPLVLESSVTPYDSQDKSGQVLNHSQTPCAHHYAYLTSPYSAAELRFSPFGLLLVMVLLAKTPSSSCWRLCAWLGEWGGLGVTADWAGWRGRACMTYNGASRESAGGVSIFKHWCDGSNVQHRGVDPRQEPEVGDQLEAGAVAW